MGKHGGPRGSHPMSWGLWHSCEALSLLVLMLVLWDLSLAPRVVVRTAELFLFAVCLGFSQIFRL